MARKFKDMQTPEQQYAARQAGATARMLQQHAYSADQEAQKQQMTADVYGRPGTDYEDTGKARQASEKAAKLRTRRDRLAAQAREQQATANGASRSKRRRWF
jgi:hypothetical protein